MQVFQKSPLIDDEGNISFLNRIRGTLQYGNSWYRDVLAQEDVIRALSSGLDNRYTLLRNLVLPDAGVPIPLVLVGPVGVWVITVSGLRGAYRAREDSWQRMENGHFRPVRPNLVRSTMLMARALQVFLERQNVRIPEVQTALLFTDPAQHVDTLNPVVRVVLSDAFDRFALSITRQEEKLSPQELQAILDALSHTTEPAGDTEKEDAFALSDGKDDLIAQPRQAARSAQPSSGLDAFLARVNINRKQAILLGGMFAVEVMILFAFILLLLFRP